MQEERQTIIEELTKNLYDLEKWPHYSLLFEDIVKVIETINQKDKIALLERCYIYDGFSIFSSLFDIGELDIFNFIPPNSHQKDRQNSQLDKLDFLPKTKKKIKKSQFLISFENYNDVLSARNKYDFILIPNVLHHHPNPFELFQACNSALNERGRLYIFDATLRENHQRPDDFFRFTADGISFALENNGFEIIEINSSKSPLESLIYTIDQVIQYDLPKELLKEISHLNKTIKNKYNYALQRNYENKVREYTSFPIAYSVLAQKK